MGLLMRAELRCNGEIEENQTNFVESSGIVVLQPIQGDTRTWLDDFHEDFLRFADGMRDKTVLVDLSNLETISLSLIGMAYELKEELIARNCGLFLTGLRADTVVRGLWLRVMKSLLLYSGGKSIGGGDTCKQRANQG